MNKSVFTVVTVFTWMTHIHAGGNIAAPIEEVAVVPLVMEAEKIKEAPRDFFAGIAISSMHLNNDLTDESFDTNAMLLKIGYQYNRYLGLEARYVTSLFKVAYTHGNTSNQNVDDFDTDFTNMALYLKPMYRVKNINMYALLGYGEVSLSDINGANRAESGFQWGLGLEYKVTDTMSLFVDYTNIYDARGFDYLGTDTDHLADMWSVGISYHF